MQLNLESAKRVVVSLPMFIRTSAILASSSELDCLKIVQLADYVLFLVSSFSLHLSAIFNCALL